MPTDDEVLEVLIGKAKELMDKAARAQRFANEFASDIGKPLPFESVDIETRSTGRVAIKADAFANTPTPSTAAREFLEMRKHAGAASFDEIFDALKRGGYHFGGSNDTTAKANLKIALGRDRQVRRLQNGHYGLWAWYPNVKREKEEGAEADSDETAAQPVKDEKKADDAEEPRPKTRQLKTIKSESADLEDLLGSMEAKK